MTVSSATGYCSACARGSLSPGAGRELARLTDAGYGALPICIAKTPLSLSTDPDVAGVPRRSTRT